MWHDGLLTKLRRRAEGDGGDDVLMACCLVERRYHVEEGEDAAFAWKAKDFINTWDEKLPRATDIVELLITDRNADVAVFLWDGHHGARKRGFQEIVSLFSQDDIDAIRAGSHRRCAGGGGGFKGQQGAPAQISSEFEKGIGESVKNI